MDVAGSIRWTNFKRGKSPRTVEACNLRQYFKHRSDPSELIISKVLKLILILRRATNFDFIFVLIAQAGMAIVSVAHDNPAFDHTSFDPQDGGRLFQGKIPCL